MAFPLYLAMTASEFGDTAVLPDNPAWMACHFSCYGTGLSNFPSRLPKGAMLILNDRTPAQHNDPVLIARQLLQAVEQWALSCVLLDFQRPGSQEAAAIAEAIVRALPCPVGITESYAGALTCPVFLSPPPLHCPLAAHLAPWKGREVWLEAALEHVQCTITAEGSHLAPVQAQEPKEPNFEEPALHCRYHLEIAPQQAVFTLYRTPETLSALLREAETLGVTKAVGLYQELYPHWARISAGEKLPG